MNDRSKPQSLKNTALIVSSMKLYGFLIFLLLFLKIPVRNGDKGFFYKPVDQSSEERWQRIEENFWERLTPYDGQWYLDIAERGYRKFTEPRYQGWQKPPGSYAFFPLLPMGLRGFNLVLGDSYLPAALVALILISGIGVIISAAIGRGLGTGAILTALLLLAFPTAAFQYVLYTEGLFLCLSALTLYFAIKRRPWLAAASGVLVGLTRPQGILLALPLFFELVIPALKRMPGVSRWAVLPAAVIATLSPLSSFLAMAWISNEVAGSTLAFLSIQSRWGRTSAIGGPVEALVSAIGYKGPPVDLLGLLFGLGMLPFIWRRLPLSLSIYGTAMVLMPLLTGSLVSMGRFMSVSIPHFLALAFLLEKTPLWAKAAVISALIVCQVMLSSGLVAWYWVG